MAKDKKRFSLSRIIPCDPTSYDLPKAISKYPYIEWRQNCKPEIGSTIYVYYGLNGGQQLRYEFYVLDRDIMSPTIDDTDCALKPEGIAAPGKKFMRLKFVREIRPGTITLKDMLVHGLSKYPQNQVRVPLELQRFIDSTINGFNKSNRS